MVRRIKPRIYDTLVTPTNSSGPVEETAPIIENNVVGSHEVESVTAPPGAATGGEGDSNGGNVESKRKPPGQDPNIAKDSLYICVGMSLRPLKDTYSMQDGVHESAQGRTREESVQNPLSWLYKFTKCMCEGIMGCDSQSLSLAFLG